MPTSRESLAPAAAARPADPAITPEARARDEQFWRDIRTHYTMPDDFTQLEFGWYHPCTNTVLARQIAAMQESQRRGSHYKRGEMPADREHARRALARVAEADPEETVITRSTTEAINTVIQGLPLGRGDEIVHCDQDYPSIVEALQQRAARDGLILKEARVPLHPESDEEIVAAFAAVITPRTRVLVLTHLINHTGQILPLAKLCRLGRAHGLHILVDAAHSFAQLAFTLRDVDCDYFAASLHKWLGAPLGTGLLYVRRDRVEALTPLFGDTRKGRADIRKLERYGSGPDYTYPGLLEAIRWHEHFGTGVKEARLRYLQRRWTDVARTLPRLRMLTPESPLRHGPLGAFALDGTDPAAVVKTLWDEHRLFVNVVNHPVVRGVRATPGLPTTTEEIDRLVAALRKLTGVGAC